MGMASLPIPKLTEAAHAPAAPDQSHTTSSRAPANTPAQRPPAEQSGGQSTGQPARSAARQPIGAPGSSVRADNLAPVTRTQASRTGSVDLPAARAPDTSPAAARSPEQRLQLLQTLDESEVRGCTKCVLHEKRTQTVFGEGDPQAQLMFIGEGPGEQEDRQGRPFVGPAGQLLEKMIKAMGLSRETVYIANAVKCRPPGNRAPLPDETHTCSSYLKQQIAIVRPRVIVTLGEPATKLMLNTTMGISGIRGRWHDFNFTDNDGQTLNIPIMPTFHPSYVLRRYTPEVRKDVWDDLQLVMAYLKQV